MNGNKTTFALFFGNRGFFPASLQASARRTMEDALRKLGHAALALDSAAARHGAVETPAEGRVYAGLLRQKRGQYGGVIGTTQDGVLKSLEERRRGT